MKATSRAVVIAGLGLSMLLVVAFAGDLGSREARQRIASALGLDKPDAVRIKSISTGPGDQAIVEASVETAFRLVKDKEGSWRAVEVRSGDRRWESFELMNTAITREKVLRTTADLRTLAVALESFRRDRGFYVVGETGAALVDNLAPRYLNSVIRLDAWSRELAYRGTQVGYRLSSLGPDGKPDTADDIVLENGQVSRGAAE